MTLTQHSLRYAGSAIAAALALASTPSLAQDAATPFPAPPEPVIVVPEIPVPVTPEPTIVLPSAQPETVQPVPEASAETPAPLPVPAATAARTRVTAPAARTAPEPSPRASPAEPAAVDQATVVPPAETVVPVALAPIPPVTEPVRQTAGDDTGLLALILGGLVFLALAIWGFIAIGSRRPVRRYAAETIAPTPVTAAPKPVVIEQASVAGREPVALAPCAVTPLNAPSFTAQPAPASGALAHTGASVALPARTPENYAERDALMKRMIAARPDRANPFTDRGARTKRARLILQSLGRDFGETEPWIDLSQYPNNWPELARKRSAAA